MKKTFGIIVLILAFSSMLSATSQETNLKPRDSIPFTIRPTEQSRDTPNVEFLTEPVLIMENYYDYFPGSYNRSPIALQPWISQPFDYPADGIYLTFQAKETIASQRRVYYAYLNDNGELVQLAPISNENVREGFPSIAMDPITASPIIAYHRLSEENTYDCCMSYDLFHLLGGPGTWKSPFVTFSYPAESKFNTESQADTSFQPRIAIGPSPLEDKRRCYLLLEKIPDYSDKFKKTFIGYADYEDYTMIAQEELDFTFVRIPELEDLPPDTNVAMDLVVADDGKVALVGWNDTTFFMALSDDFGESYSFTTKSAQIEIENPRNLDGSYAFDSTPFFYPSPDGKNFNAVFNEYSDTILLFSTMSINTIDSYKQGFYYPQFNYPKIYQFSIENEELQVNIIDLQITGLFPDDGYPMVPWDLDEDGIPDEYDENGNVVIPLAFPYYYQDESERALLEPGIFKLSQKGDYLIATWQDTEKMYWHHQGAEGYEEWAEQPEIMISVSSYYGDYWTQPARLNANESDTNFYPELTGMTPVYVYPTEKFRLLDYYSAFFPIFFTDDYSYGSSVSGNGEDVGSMLYYAELGVDFFYLVSSMKNPIPVSNPQISSNYPNPFNPSTTIQFELAEAGEVSLEIFNIKGQKVKTLANEFLPIGKHERIWYGKDENNLSVSSGIYLYKLRAGKYTSHRKMILMK